MPSPVENPIKVLLKDAAALVTEAKRRAVMVCVISELNADPGLGRTGELS